MLNPCMDLNHMYVTWSAYSNPLQVIDRVGQTHCCREKGLLTQCTAHRSSDPWVRTQFLSRANQWSSGESQTFVDRKLLGLLGPYHRHAIGMFNTCSRGPTHRSLIDTGGGYSLEGANFPQTTPRPSQPAVFTFHLRVPPGLQFNHIPPIKSNFKFKDPMATTWSSNHSAIYRGLHLCLAIANGLSLAIGFTRIDWKVILM
jgi:hypothetical protein